LGQIAEISQNFSKVIHVGHSFGSVQSYWLSALYPNNTDGLVLTGYSANSSFFPTTVAAWNLHNARLNQPLRLGNATNLGIVATLNSFNLTTSLIPTLQTILSNAGINVSQQDIWTDIATTELGNLLTGANTTGSTPLNYPSGYLTQSDYTANRYVFLHPGHFDIGLGILAEQTKQPVTTGEILTIGNSPMSSTFTGPVLVFTGENDQPFCGGDCFATGGALRSIPDSARMQFPNAGAFEAYVQPATGHGLNAHYNATAGYEAVQAWLGSNRLQA
jgi:pimeloyl-ACP methyl ester carboxylesterase